MYAIRKNDGTWLEQVICGGVNTNTERSHAQRFATVEQARAVYRTLPEACRFLIVCAEEDEK